MCFLSPNAISPNGWYLVMPFPPWESASKRFGVDMNHLGVPGSFLWPAVQWLDSEEAKAGKDAEDLIQYSNLTCHLHLFENKQT